MGAGEALRFLVVYGRGALICWIVGFVAGRHVLPRYVDRQVAELGGALIGAGVMTLTSYFGHRFFTYATFHLIGPS